jgi:hypothetical protein
MGSASWWNADEKCGGNTERPTDETGKGTAVISSTGCFSAAISA